MARTSQQQSDALIYNLVKLIAASGEEWKSVSWLATQMGITVPTVVRYLHQISHFIPGLIDYSAGKVRVIPTLQPKIGSDFNVDVDSVLANAATTAVRKFSKNGDAIIINAGHTGYVTAVALSESKIIPSVVFTNSLLSFELLHAKYDQRVLLSGGRYNAKSERFEGTMAVKALENFHANVTFTSFAGIAKQTLYENFDFLLPYQRSLFESKQSSLLILISDWRKIGRLGGYRVAGLEEIESDWHLVIGFDENRATPGEVVAMRSELQLIDESKWTIVPEVPP